MHPLALHEPVPTQPQRARTLVGDAGARHASRWKNSMPDGMTRRTFLNVLGASGATVAAGCGSRGPETLVPYVIAPEEIVPGMPTWYASTCRECPAGCGIMVETHEGRVTKVEGNPAHPVSHGNLCPRGQASVQGLYHPDRYQGPQITEYGVPNPRQVSWSQAQQAVAEAIRRAPRGSVAFLTGGYTGTMDRLADQFVGAIGARRVDWTPLADAPRDLRFADADLLVSFGADFLETWGSPVDYAWQFARMRDYRNGRRGRFAWVGPHRPLTGLNADLWIPTLPGTEALVAQALAGEADLDQVAAQIGVQGTSESRLAALRTLTQWWAESGRKVALGPGAAVHGSNAEALRQAVDRLNGGVTAPPADARPVLELVRRMAAGAIQVVLVDAPNPVYTLPGGAGFAEAFAQVPVRVSFSSFPDDTSVLCTHVLPQSHFLERWDDYVPYEGVRELVQPAMRPIFNTKAVGETLLGVADHLALLPDGTPTEWLDYLRSSWGLPPEAWREAVKLAGIYPPTGRGTGALGFLPLVDVEEGTARAAPAVPAVQPADPLPETAGQPESFTPGPRAIGAVAYEAPAYDGPENGLHLVVYPSTRFYDGRTANRPWLLELPDPVTKVSWDSWVEMHPATAGELGVDQGDEVEITSPHGSLTTRVYIYPGIVPGAVALQMGLGHRAFGRYTEGVGVNPMELLGPAVAPRTGAFRAAGVRVRVDPTGEKATRRVFPDGLFESGVRVQHDRRAAQAIALEELRRLDAAGPGAIPGAWNLVPELKGAGGFVPMATYTDPAAYPPPGTLYGEYVEAATRWAMVIDLSRCIGCSACVVACSAENNIPVVGPKELRRGRELQWLRIERYFGVGRDEREAYRDDATDDVRFLPMLCQHCGQAPCEPVCPVYAAYHTPDGLNGQVYNRCVGTRYCANNCPWKVRVFNWFTYEFIEPLNWQLNPDVTVREKGVMEKCTFCVQRIHEAERNVAAEQRPLADGDVVPACVQTCPTEVFVFGNIADPDSAVAQAARSNRGYRVLEELNTHPAIVYLKKVTLHIPENGGHERAGAEPPAGDDAAPRGGH
jgi:anaerobic selenocysteine-containing dehydrogenase/Fe-S-cluster-containing dehydrogenase component